VLTPYSSQSLAVLLSLLPDLEPHVRIEGKHFEVKVTSPAGWELWVCSPNEEITVGFAVYHTHFGWHQGDPKDDAADGADFIRALCSGELVLAMWFTGAEYAGSRPIAATQNPLPQTWLDRWWRRKQTLVVKKWAE
jgi:hypothetical protein